MEAGRAATLSLDDLVLLFNRCFAGYVVRFEMTAQSLAHRIAAEDIDLSASRTAIRAGAAVGLALISRRGRESRLSAMGVVQEARGSGAGRLLVDTCLADARARADTVHWLEVFEGNLPARRLYESAGFGVVARLAGFEGSLPPALDAGLREHDPAQFAAQLALETPPELPWQLQPATLACPLPGARCFSLDGRAFALLYAIEEKSMQLRGLFTLPAARRQGLARRLLAAISAQLPGRRIVAPSLVPEGLADAFYTRLNFTRTAQLLLNMKLAL